MNFGILAGVNHLIFLVSLAVLCVYGSLYAWKNGQYWRHRRRAAVAEKRLLDATLPPDGALPDVLVQIPIFNEGVLIWRALAAATRLDWPADRLHVQVLDDSNDLSAEIASTAVDEFQRLGHHVVLIQRTTRSGFKAGALKAGLARSVEPFVAIFDVDHVPPADFLRRCIRPLLADPTLAFVQARLDCLNANETPVTLIQQHCIDGIAINQASRAWSGSLIDFGGTCGIWRRAAIDAAGGWQGETLAEDLDLAYRAQVSGWYGSFLMSVAVPGELPTTFKDWLPQQARWTKGNVQVVRKILPLLLSSKLSVRRKIRFTAHLAESFLTDISGIALAIAVVADAIDLTLGAGLTTGTMVLSAIFAAQMLFFQSTMVLSQVEIRRASWSAELVRVPLVIIAYGWMIILIGRATVEALLGFKTEFVRTPKRGGPAGAGQDHQQASQEY
jgi:cellulose synthase/poly-beta-1,6-N-acetylglucosamine synthase-like glycosyltransferase